MWVHLTTTIIFHGYENNQKNGSSRIAHGLSTLRAMGTSVGWRSPKAVRPTSSLWARTRRTSHHHLHPWLRDTGLAFQKYIDGKDEQKWKLVEVPNKQDCYQLVNAEGELAFDMALNDPKQASGYPCMWTETITNPNQQIYITKKGNGYQLSAVSGRNGQTYYVTTGVQKGNDPMPCGWERSQSSAATVHFKEVAPVVIPQAADWENATVYERNKEQGHATYMPYPSTAAMKADGQRYDKPWLEPTGANYLSLNGTWRLRWSEGPKPVL